MMILGRVESFSWHSQHFGGRRRLVPFEVLASSVVQSQKGSKYIPTDRAAADLYILHVLAFQAATVV